MGKKTKFTTIKPFSRQILSALPSSVRNTTHTHCVMTSAKCIGHALLVYFICRLIKRRANQSGHVYFNEGPLNVSVVPWPCITVSIIGPY